MKRSIFLAALGILCLIIIVGSTSCRQKIYNAKMYVCETNGERECLTFRFDGQFFYVRPAINRSLSGRWDIKKDTFILQPAFLYSLDNDSAIIDVIQWMPEREIPDPYWTIKLQAKGKTANGLIDVTDYSAIFPDSVLPPSLPRREFKWVK